VKRPHEEWLRLCREPDDRSYLNGHSDMVGGVYGLSETRIERAQGGGGGASVLTDCRRRLQGRSIIFGDYAAQDPALRMERMHIGMKIAAWLEVTPKSKSGFYPGLQGHPQKRARPRQMHALGADLGRTRRHDRRCRRFPKRCKLFALDESRLWRGRKTDRAS